MGDDRYSPDPLNGPAQFADALREINRRLDALEGRSGKGVQPIIFDPATGNELIRLGRLDDGTHGLLIKDLAGRTMFKVTAENGQTAPRVGLPIYPNSQAYLTGQTVNAFRPGTNSATMFELWRTDFYSIGPIVSYDLIAFANGGNMTWRILCYEYGGGTPTVVVGPTVETTSVQRQGTFTIPAACLIPATGSDPAGRRMTMRIEAQLNSGAVTADIAVNAPPINYS